MPDRPPRTPDEAAADFLRRHPIPLEFVELAADQAHALAHGTLRDPAHPPPRPRPAAEGIRQMTALLAQLKQEKRATLAAIDQIDDPALFSDLAEINRQIADTEARLAEYQAQAAGGN